MCFILLGQYVLLISLCFSPALKTELLIPLTVFFLSCLSLQYLGDISSFHKFLFRATEITHFLQVGK